ncbi:hypothetical protein GCM10027446_16820 [Angustibacter peucedani]
MHRSTAGCQGIVPPYLLEQLARSGSEPAARCAGSSLALDTRHRQQRLATAVVRPRAAAPTTTAGPRRTVSDAHGSTTLPGDVVRTEGAAATGDAAADEAYDGLGLTWSLYSEVYGRDSLDGNGLPLDATVHYGDRYDNAFWDGERMVFGDGDGVTFQRFTVAVDVIGHELTHGVTSMTAGLVYQGQSGALNESVSDVFGSLVKQRALGQDAASADWLIGAGLFTDDVKGVALRSLKAPGTAYDDPTLGKDPQPATMDGYVTTTDDNGGVHLNSGIPNHAFYLAASAIGGRAWEGAGQVWYDVLTGGALAADVDFAGFAAATVAAATTRFGEGSAQAQAVAQAWEQVGVGPAAGPTPAPDPAAPRDRVVVERSGGFAGRTVARDVDLTALPEPDAERWRHLLASPLLHDLVEQAPQPDRYVYRVAHRPGGLDVRAAEQQLPADVRDLLERALRE